MFNILFFSIIFILSNRFFYFLTIKIKSLFVNKLFTKEIQLEFNKGFFLVSLPTNDYKLYTSLPKDFKIIYDFEGFLFPVLKGIKVFYKNPFEKKYVFYAKIADITVKNKENFPHNHILFLLFNKKQKNFIKQNICKKLRERIIEL